MHFLPALRYVLVFSLIGSAPAFAQEVTLKVHHFLPTGSTAHAKFIVPWCNKIDKESSGKLKCQIYPSMQLGGSPPQLIDQVRDGIADIVWTLPGYTPGRFPIVEVFELPFMTNNAEVASRAVWEFVEKYDQAEFKVYKPLAFHVHDEGYIHTIKTPVKSMADFKGLKMRAPTRLTNKLLTSLGAIAVGMPVPAVTEALSKGVIDGALLPWEVVPTLKVHEMVKHHSETDNKSPALYTAVFIFAMNPAKYESLPADLKKVIDNNSGAALSAWIGKIWDESAHTARKLAQERGNNIHVIPASELSQWQKASQSVIDDWVKEITAKGVDGQALLQAARAMLKQNAKK